MIALCGGKRKIPVRKADNMRTSCCTLPILLALFFYATDTNGDGSYRSAPELAVLPSKYIVVLSSALSPCTEGLAFDCTFLVRGRGIFGGFEVTAYGDNDSIICVKKGDARAYRRNHAPKTKTIRIILEQTQGVRRVEVSFREMRMATDTGFVITPNR